MIDNINICMAIVFSRNQKCQLTPWIAFGSFGTRQHYHLLKYYG
jgi:hypothetical protein